MRKIVTWLEFRTLRDCDRVITVSELQRQTLLAMGFSPDRVTVVRPGIPYLEAGGGHLASSSEREQARERWGLPAEAFVISAVGRLSTEKRFDLFLQACAEIASAVPQARFMLVGGGKQEAALKTQAHDLGLDEKLVFTGLTRDMRMVYAATDLLMLTSDTEGTPHVLLEAMGSGIPTVSTSVGGVPEFITSEKDGLLVPPGNYRALAEAALRVHGDRNLRERLVRSGYEIAQQFSVERMVEGEVAVYDTLLPGTSRPDRTSG